MCNYIFFRLLGSNIFLTNLLGFSESVLLHVHIISLQAVCKEGDEKFIQKLYPANLCFTTWPSTIIFSNMTECQGLYVISDLISLKF